jgi:hypothetical protein
MLGAMTNTQQELLDQAKLAIQRWSAISTAMRTRTQSQIIDGYMDGVRNQRTAPFLAQQRTELTSLVNMLTEIEKDPSETSDALMNSNQWKAYKDTLTMFDNTLKAIEAYQDGKTAAFQTAFNALPDDNKVRELKAMAQALAFWDNAQSKMAAAGGSAGSDPAVIQALGEARLQLSQTLAASAPVMQEVTRTLNSLEAKRGSQASSLRQEASQLPPGADRINKLLDAFQYDSSSAAANEIDSQVVGLVGQIQRENSIAQNADKLNAIRDRINGYIEHAQMNREEMTSVNQIQTLLSRQNGK